MADFQWNIDQNWKFRYKSSKYRTLTGRLAYKRRKWPFPIKLTHFHNNCFNQASDTKSRIAIAKRRMIELQGIWNDSNCPFQLKVKLVETYAWSALVYVAESWTPCKSDDNRIMAAGDVCSKLVGKRVEPMKVYWMSLMWRENCWERLSP